MKDVFVLVIGWFYFFYCRQVEPSDDNLAANSLAFDVQNRNVKKVQIRAKVNFAIWVWETISLAVLFLVSRILQNYELTMTLFILFFYVAIPFIFLTNSSANHDRLVDVGFLKTVQNTLRLPIRSRIVPILKVPAVDAISGFECKIREEEVQKWADCLENPIKTLKLKDTGKIIGTVCEKTDEEIFTGIANTLPSSSSNHKLQSNGPMLSKIMTKGISSGSEGDNTTHLRGDMYCNLVGKIVDLMMSNIDVESRYMFYLKELCRLKYVENADSNDDLENFNIIQFEEAARSTKRQKIKSSVGYTNIMKDIVRVNNAIKNTEIELQELRVEFLGPFSQRRDLRKNMLCIFCEVSQDQASYKQFVEDLLDVEEQLRL